jgi:hypothetical protein
VNVGTPAGGRAGRGGPALLGLAALLAGVLLLVGLIGVLVATGGAGGSTTPRLPDSPAAQPVGEPPAPAGPDPTATPTGDDRRAARPVRISIPSIGVRAPVVPLGLDKSGALEVPQDFAQTGWWTGGSRPGERGPAVIVGHVDSRTGPAVFFRLGALRAGDEIVVERADGTSARFHVQRSDRYAKQRFPTAAVYGPTAGPALRLITCSGTFDRATGHYLDNTVVFAGR